MPLFSPHLVSSSLQSLTLGSQIHIFFCLLTGLELQNETGYPVNVIYLEFKKANVNHFTTMIFKVMVLRQCWGYAVVKVRGLGGSAPFSDLIPPAIV